MDQPISMKFSTVTQIWSLKKSTSRQEFEFLKIQDGVGHHCEKPLNCRNYANV